MLTPEKTPASLTEEVTFAINQRLRMNKQSKKWLANQMATDYGRVKRILNNKETQQLSIEDADVMLRLLGSSLRDVLTAQIVETLQADIAKSLKKYSVSWM